MTTPRKSVTVIETPEALVLFSYQTPVAYVDKMQGRVFETSKKWSRTTTKHIHEFYKRYVLDLFPAFNPVYVDQPVLDNKFPMSVSRF